MGHRLIAVDMSNGLTYIGTENGNDILRDYAVIDTLVSKPADAYSLSLCLYHQYKHLKKSENPVVLGRGLRAAKHDLTEFLKQDTAESED